MSGNFGGASFKVSKTGELRVLLYNFDGLSNGSGPAAGLVRDLDRNLYGTTVFGGENVFKLTLYQGELPATAQTAPQMQPTAQSRAL